MTRPTRAKIKLSALVHNLDVARQAAPGAAQMAVIKANGYGHGILRAAHGLQAADGFAVACLEEALILRDAGFQQRILLLEGLYSHQDLQTAIDRQLALVVHNEHQVDLLTGFKPAAKNSVLHVWFKIDTGMHRLGIPAEQVRDLYDRLHYCPHVADEKVLMTHFANADNRDDKVTTTQIEHFNNLTGTLPGPRSLANSGGILGFPQSHAEWNRPGIMLYGVSPFADSSGKDLGLQAVMQLESELIAINHLQKGDAVGYGGVWTCPEAMPVGVVAIGYGDGYPRHAPEGTPVMVNGTQTQLVGRVSMDMITVDLRPVPGAKIGDKVELWGDRLAVEQIATKAGTIAYELLCHVTQRVHMEMVK